jgi:hypothetical protein
VQGAFSFALGAIPPVVVPVGGNVDVTGGTLTVPAGIVATAGLFLPVTGFPLNLITGLVLTASNGAGSFAAPGAAEGGSANVPGGGFGGKMPIIGVVQVKGALAINVPLSVIGQGGTNAGVVVVDGAPWTTGIGMVTTTGAAMATVQAAGTQVGALGAATSTVTLVTPVHVNAAGLSRLPAFGTLNLHFVPEPGPLLLTALGAGALAAFGRRRSR